MAEGGRTLDDCKSHSSAVASVGAFVDCFDATAGWPRSINAATVTAHSSVYVCAILSCVFRNCTSSQYVATQLPGR